MGRFTNNFEDKRPISGQFSSLISRKPKRIPLRTYSHNSLKKAERKIREFPSKREGGLQGNYLYIRPIHNRDDASVLASIIYSWADFTADNPKSQLLRVYTALICGRVYILICIQQTRLHGLLMAERTQNQWLKVSLLTNRRREINKFKYKKRIETHPTIAP